MKIEKEKSVSLLCVSNRKNDSFLPTGRSKQRSNPKCPPPPPHIQLRGIYPNDQHITWLDGT